MHSVPAGRPARRPRQARFAAVAALAVAVGCARFGPVYPARPAPSSGPALADPSPARIVTHLSVSSAALAAALDGVAPSAGEGHFSLLGSERPYQWERGPLEVSVSQGRVALRTAVRAKVSLPLATLALPLEIRIEAEPVVTGGYAVKLQSVEVHVSSSDGRLALAERFADVYEGVGAQLAAQIKDFAYDLRPLLGEAFARVGRPIAFSVGDAQACAQLRVLEVEAGPTVLADGIEKDVAAVVAPSVTLPCPEGANAAGASAPLPPFLNVATVPSGPFTVTIPIAARYEELTRAMGVAFTDGKLFFSPEYPNVYLEHPELYESDGQLVLKLHIAGPVRGLGIDTDLDGDLYLVGHPAVVDNELRVPDLTPTIETKNLLLSLKALTSADRIRDQARSALRLDIGARIDEARERLGSDLTFGTEKGCFLGDVDHVDVTGVYPHAAYLRVYVAVTARTRATMPCPVPPRSTPG
jgi:hypothetical protein